MRVKCGGGVVLFWFLFCDFCSPHIYGKMFTWRVLGGYLHSVRMGDTLLRRTEKPSYLLAVESLTHCCSHTSFIIDLIETSYMGKRCSNLFVWYSCSVILPVIVALCVKIFTLHWALVQIFLYEFGKGNACPWLVLFYFPK